MAGEVEFLEATAYRPYRTHSAKIAQLTTPDEHWHGDALMVELVLDAMFAIAERKVAALPVSNMKMTVNSTGHRRRRMSTGSTDV